MRPWGALSLGAAVAALLALPSGAGAAVTVGNDLSATPNSSYSTAEAAPQTSVIFSIGPDFVAPGGAIASLNGTIVRWRIRAGLDSPPVSLRVVRAAGNAYQGAGTSAVVNPPSSAISTYPTSLPIKAGERIGITCCAADAGGTYFRSGGGTFARLFDALPDGGPIGSPVSSPTEQVLVNADVEPTAAFTVLGRKAKKRGKVRLSLDLPNPGTVVVRNKGSKLLKARTVTAGDEGVTAFGVKPSKRGRAALADGDRIKAKLSITFTPSFGSPFVRTAKVKLKP